MSYVVKFAKSVLECGRMIDEVNNGDCLRDSYAGIICIDAINSLMGKTVCGGKIVGGLYVRT